MPQLPNNLPVIEPGTPLSAKVMGLWRKMILRNRITVTSPLRAHVSDSGTAISLDVPVWTDLFLLTSTYTAATTSGTTPSTFTMTLGRCTGRRCQISPSNVVTCLQNMSDETLYFTAGSSASSSFAVGKLAGCYRVGLRWFVSTIAC